MQDIWKRVTKQNPCPVCGKPDWCLIHEDSTSVICPRTSDGCVKDLGDAGYLHHLEGHQSNSGRVYLPKKLPAYDKGLRPIAKQPKPDFDAARVMRAYRTGLSSLVLRTWATLLGVQPDSLTSLGLGCSARGAMAFPMKSAMGEVIGIRLRSVEGRKWAYPGSRNGLFMPDDRDSDGLICICEGPTDTAAMLGLGFDAIGRPSCSGGREMLKLLCANRDVCIMEDPDGPGQRGAETLADDLTRLCDSVRVVSPLIGKDVREWITESRPTWQVVSAVLRSAPQWHRGRRARSTSA